MARGGLDGGPVLEQKNAASRARGGSGRLERERRTTAVLRDRAAASARTERTSSGSNRSLAGAEKGGPAADPEAIEELARAPASRRGNGASGARRWRGAGSRGGGDAAARGSYEQLVGSCARSRPAALPDGGPRWRCRADNDGPRCRGAQHVPAPPARPTRKPGRDAERSRGVTYLELIATGDHVIPLGHPPMGGWRCSGSRDRAAAGAAGHAAAIDHTSRRVDQGQIGGDVKLAARLSSRLETLVKGSTGGTVDRKLSSWAHRGGPMRHGGVGASALQDDPDNTSWCGDNGWDVYSKSAAKGWMGRPTTLVRERWRFLAGGGASPSSS